MTSFSHSLGPFPSVHSHSCCPFPTHHKAHSHSSCPFPVFTVIHSAPFPVFTVTPAIPFLLTTMLIAIPSAPFPVFIVIPAHSPQCSQPFQLPLSQCSQSFCPFPSVQSLLLSLSHSPQCSAIPSSPFPVFTVLLAVPFPLTNPFPPIVSHSRVTTVILAIVFPLITGCNFSTDFLRRNYITG